MDYGVFYLASWNEMKEAKAKGLDVSSFYFPRKKKEQNSKNVMYK
jgi:hypothetical protein